MVKVLWYCSQSAKSNKAWLVDDDKSKFVSNYNVILGTLLYGHLSLIQKTRKNHPKRIPLHGQLYN